MDINSVLWIWSTRTPTHTEILLHGLVLILHFYGTCARTHAKCSARTQVSCTSPNPVNYIYWVEIRSTPKHQLNNINYMGSCDLHIDRVWACAIIQAWGECLVYGLSNWAIHIYIYTVKCHYNACHYNANASLTRSILGSQTAPTSWHALMTVPEWLSTWAKGVKSSRSDRPQRQWHPFVPIQME